MVRIGDSLVCLFPFKAEKPEDLTIDRKEVVSLVAISKDRTWVSVKNEKKIQGQVPFTHLEDLATTKNSWFRTELTRRSAEEFLKTQSNGAFIVRLSNKFIGDYTLSLINNSQLDHYRVKVSVGASKEKDSICKNYAIDDDNCFKSLSHLIQYYQYTGEGLSCRLLIKEDPRLKYLNMHKFKISCDEVALSTKLGNGEFADVYKATYKNELCAVKILRESANESAIKLLVSEAYAMSLLYHPHIVRFLGYFKPNPESYCLVDISQDNNSSKMLQRFGLVIEYMSIGSLEHYLQTRGRAVINLQMQLRFARETCSALAYLEKRKFIHRDVAARNVLLNENLVAKLSDFGLMLGHSTASMEETSSADVSSRIPIRWTAPEAIRTKKFSNKTDVWSFGVLLWEIFTFGRMPYPQIAAAQVGKHIENGLRLEPPNDCYPLISKIMRNCWEDDPAKRPDFTEIYQQLE